jgi:hypothetical protein
MLKNKFQKTKPKAIYPQIFTKRERGRNLRRFGMSRRQNHGILFSELQEKLNIQWKAFTVTAATQSPMDSGAA